MQSSKKSTVQLIDVVALDADLGANSIGIIIDASACSLINHEVSLRFDEYHRTLCSELEKFAGEYENNKKPEEKLKMGSNESERHTERGSARE